MAKPRTTTEEKVKKTKQLRLIMMCCGLFTILNVGLRVSTGPFNLLFTVVEVLLGLGCLIYGLHLGKTVKSLKTGQNTVK